MDPATLSAARDAIHRAGHIVFFTGAGMSAESGIPTFRDALTGLWERFDPALLASAEGFESDPELVWGWYEWRRQKVMQAAPNAGHRAIAAFTTNVRPRAVHVVTQNVDDLHERAGSEDVVHLHGSILAPRCFACATPAPPELINMIPDEPEGGRRLRPPPCALCGGPVRPGVVWFGESLPSAAFDRATRLAQTADTFVVVGTSGVVEPAASLVRRAGRQGAAVIVVDPNLSASNREATCWLEGSAGDVLPALLDVR
ncbi:SIR2 family NAD-dependent protein deacylase [Casimicrobium huifangae]|jgi:NAD-dependent deacetylase|uniref:SIR2 family NAD-dependent protein deacylase n=1 Tax=Casimicrobium huifangae TaxID=2591109 RepID=UPI0012EC2658|nr:NAD-dependent deacylase [Casimicrobium huifangae]